MPDIKKVIEIMGFVDKNDEKYTEVHLREKFGDDSYTDFSRYCMGGTNPYAHSVGRESLIKLTQDGIRELERLKTLHKINAKPAEFQISYDGNLDVKKSDIIAIMRGIRKGNSIRASTVKNIKTGRTQASGLDGVMMTENTIEFNPPVICKVGSSVEFRNNTTTFRASEITVLQRIKRKKWSRAVEKTIYSKYGGKCAICDEDTSFDKGEIDHEAPLARGGQDEVENLQWTCYRCNKIKSHTKTNDEVREVLRIKKSE